MHDPKKVLPYEVRSRTSKHHVMGVEVTGTPKTVNLAGTLAEHPLEGPLEVWVASLVAVLDADQKVKFAKIFEEVMRQREAMERTKILLARSVADIPMGKIPGG